MNDPEPPKKGWGCLQWGVVGVLVLLGVGYFITVVLELNRSLANQTLMAGKTRRIVMAIKVWALDHDGQYPSAIVPEDRRSANAVFRELFRAGILTQEVDPFSPPESPFRADGIIGEPPDFSQAVQAGENHWMMVDGMTTASPGHYPLIFENALDGSWPPKWQPQSAGKLTRGRVWSDETILIFFNDNSGRFMKLKRTGDHLTLPDEVLAPKGLSTVPTLKVLDIETDRR